MISPPPSLPLDIKVSYLIDAESAAWKSNQIQNLFMSNEARLILNITLSFKRPPDRLIWSQTPIGVFTTSSAYKLLVNNASTNSAGSLNPNPRSHFEEDFGSCVSLIN